MIFEILKLTPTYEYSTYLTYPKTKQKPHKILYYHPLSLINTDIKIFIKAFARSCNTVLSPSRSDQFQWRNFSENTQRNQHNCN